MTDEWPGYIGLSEVLDFQEGFSVAAPSRGWCRWSRGSAGDAKVWAVSVDPVLSFECSDQTFPCHIKHNSERNLERPYNQINNKGGKDLKWERDRDRGREEQRRGEGIRRRRGKGEGEGEGEALTVQSWLSKNALSKTDRPQTADNRLPLASKS